MERNQLTEALDKISDIVGVNNTKEYWMVRTDDGNNYDCFAKGEFVALNLQDYPTQFLLQIEHDYPNIKDRFPIIKQSLIKFVREGLITINYQEGDKAFSSKIGRLAKQISYLAYSMKRGDIVLIPDHGANRIKIGKITDDGLSVVENNNFSFSRRVQWLKEISKRRLDPCLYKALGAHQAICNITKYAEYIERNYNSYFTLDNRFHYVLAVNAETVSAWKLSNMVYDILNSVKSISEENELNIDVENINLTINVNSPGKFSFITTARNAVLIMAVVAAFSGGAIKYGDFEMTTNGAFQTLIECVNKWKDAQQERNQKARIFDACMKSLEMRSVESTNDAFDAEEDYLENIEDEGNDEDEM